MALRFETLPTTFGTDSANRLADAADRGPSGAVAALETFYAAFNGRDAALMREVWLDRPDVALSNPLGGVRRGVDAIVELYERIFRSDGRAWVELSDVTAMQAGETVAFVGRESGEYAGTTDTVALAIRTSRWFSYDEDAGRWQQIHHHGSIDDPQLLDRYQRAVAGRPAAD